MAEVEQDLFAVCVFQDGAWAARGVAALTQQGFGPAELSVVAKDSPEAAAFVEQCTGGTGERLDLPVAGPVVARGTLLDALQGPSRDLGRAGLAASMRRAGFQPHDGLIFETLLSRGGTLVAVSGAPRVADALSVMLSYGGGNASIGAWSGRV